MKFCNIVNLISIIHLFANITILIPKKGDGIIPIIRYKSDVIYDITKLHKMYDYLTSHGSCFYIQYEGVLVGDVTLQDNSELSIVISKEYQNLQIGRRCISEMIQMAKEKEMVKVTAQIYPFNTQSQRMFLALGFQKVDEEWYEYKLI